MDYPVFLEKQAAGRVRVGFPDFPNVHTVGTDEADGLHRAEQALATALEAHIRERRDIPAPSPVTAEHVAVPALIEAKIRLYQAMRDAKLGKAALAQRLGWHPPQVDRLFDLKHGSRVDQLEAAFAALGKRLVVAVQDVDRSEPVRPPKRASARAKSTAPQKRSAPPSAPSSAFEVQWD
jgi:antitoxin HicB